MPIRKNKIVKDNDNLTIERPTFVTHLECAMEGDHYPADQIHNLSKANKPLLVRYDLAGVKKALTKEALAQRPLANRTPEDVDAAPDLEDVLRGLAPERGG